MTENKTKKQLLVEESLIKSRHQLGLYSLKEICIMFNCSRYSLDNPINSGELNYISPNNKNRYIFLNDYLEYLKNKGRC